MSKTNPSKAPKPAAHLEMIADMIGKGFIVQVGDLYEITDAGHEHTRALTAAFPSFSTFESNEEEQ